MATYWGEGYLLREIKKKEFCVWCGALCKKEIISNGKRYNSETGLGVGVGVLKVWCPKYRWYKPWVSHINYIDDGNCDPE